MNTTTAHTWHTASAQSAVVPNGGPHVHVRVGGCNIAVPIAQVRQALPLQGLTLLPRRQAGALLGVVNAEGGAVPIVSLGRWVPLDEKEEEDTEAAQRRLLLLQHHGNWIGIRVDAVLGVKMVAPGAVRRVHQVSDADELFESVVPATAHCPTLCVLEVARLMHLSQIWCAEADVQNLSPHAADAADSATQHQAVQTQRHAVFQIGSELWAVPVQAIEQVVPVPGIELALGRTERSWAICQWQDRKLPLVDISADRRAASAQEAPWMVLLSHGPMRLGLTVTACKQFVDLAKDAATSTPNDPLLAGITMWPGLGKLRVLDPAKLFQLTPEAAISLNTPAAKSSVVSNQMNAAESTPYIVFDADQRYASPVTGVVGVVELSEQTIQDLRSEQRAVMAWRGQTISVVKLPAIGKPDSKPAAEDSARLAVLVKANDDDSPPLGIAIKSLSDWLPAHSAQRSGVRMGTMGEFSLINVPGPSHQTSLVVVDLAEMAHLLS